MANRIEAYAHQINPTRQIWGVGIRGEINGQSFDQPRWLLRTWATQKTAVKKAQNEQKTLDQYRDYYVRFCLRTYVGFAPARPQ